MSFNNDSIQERDAADRRTLAKALPVAEQLRDLLLDLHDSDRRSEVLGVIRERICLKCYDIDCSGWCDYRTPMD